MKTINVVHSHHRRGYIIENVPVMIYGKLTRDTSRSIWPSEETSKADHLVFVEYEGKIESGNVIEIFKEGDEFEIEFACHSLQDLIYITVNDIRYMKHTTRPVYNGLEYNSK